MASWVEAVTNAIRRHVAETGSAEFRRQDFIDAELSVIIAATGTSGLTPAQTLGRELQQLRDAGLVAFVAPGVYRWLADDVALEAPTPSHAIFVLAARADRRTLPERRFTFNSSWLRLAQRTAGQWVLYQGAEGYGAAARVTHVAVDELRRELADAWIESSSYLEFGRTVPFEIDGRATEAAAAGGDGAFDYKRSTAPIRTITVEDFNSILEYGLLPTDELLPRDAGEDATLHLLMEERSQWDGPVDRSTMLVERKVRDRQFRQRVLGAYGARCALTGMKLINGGGRPETQAAHIKSVAAGGPDSLNNGIALSGTVHWMFDRGLISLSNGGDILLSRAINDREGVERLIHRDHKARFPVSAAQRPHPDYLQWHRTECFHH